MARTALQDWLAALLRSETPGFPTDEDPGDLEQLVTAHGVGSLVHEALADNAVGREVPGHFRVWLKELAMAEAAAELARAEEIKGVLADLRRSGVEMLVIKGTALAYSLYPRPALRPRGDTDLWIRPADRQKVDQVLRKRGYETGLSAGGETAVRQLAYSLHTAKGIAHSLDVHWNLTDSPLLREAFSRDEAVHAALPVPALGEEILTLGHAHALLFACVHRIKHRHSPYYVGSKAQFEPDRLIWLYDLRLLAEALDEPGWRVVLDSAERGRVRAVVADGLAAARQLVGAEIPDWVMSTLTAPGVGEPSSRLLRSGHVGAFFADLASFKPADRVRYLRDVLFPPRAYMREKYANSRAPLAWLYLRRIISGVGKRISGNL
ncbi:MAG: nucleotidyltransferase family protein [Xanthomonadales bacterium]|nr:nucleotidyltransferase family protein [Xanthomonadales bacterium]